MDNWASYAGNSKLGAVWWRVILNKCNQLMLSKKNKLLHCLVNSKLANKNCDGEWIITCTVRVTWTTAQKIAQARKSFRLTGADRTSPSSHAGSGTVLRQFCGGSQASTQMHNHVLTHTPVHTLRSCKERAEQVQKSSSAGLWGWPQHR